MPVGQSTHREVVAVIQSRSRVQLKVRSGGLIPVRNRRSEPLSWRVVTPSERGNSGVTELVRREVEVNRAKGVPTVPTTVAQELATNPFCRPDSVLLRRTLGLEGADDVAVFAETRRRKDSF